MKNPIFPEYLFSTKSQSGGVNRAPHNFNLYIHLQQAFIGIFVF